MDNDKIQTYLANSLQTYEEGVRLVRAYFQSKYGTDFEEYEASESESGATTMAATTFVAGDYRWSLRFSDQKSTEQASR